MLIQEKLTIRQLSIIAFLGIIGDMMLIYPTLIAYSGHQDAWICSLLSQVLGLGILWLIYKMHQMYPGLSLIEICSEVLGKWIGAILAAGYLFYFLIGAAVCIREVGDFMTTQVYLRTPIRAIILLFVVALGWAALKGLGTFGRSAEILAPFIVLSLIILICCLLPKADSSNLKPFLNTPLFSFINGIVRGPPSLMENLSSYRCISPMLHMVYTNVGICSWEHYSEGLCLPHFFSSDCW